MSGLGRVAGAGGGEGAWLQTLLPSSGLLGALDGRALLQFWPKSVKAQSPLSTPGLGEGQALRASPTQPGTPGLARPPLTVPPAFCPGPGILNNHGHTLPANGEMNGGPSPQSMVSGSHCTPPPPYHADPSLVRYVGHCWVLPRTQ